VQFWAGREDKLDLCLTLEICEKLQELSQLALVAALV